MALTILQALERIKADVAHFLQPATISELCVGLGHDWRQRILDPVTTLHAFLLQILHGNTACSALPHLSGLSFSAAAYCAARARLPLQLFESLLQSVCSSLQTTVAAAERWRGHRTWLVDGSGFSMSDTAELQAHFGQPSGQTPGCGFPVAHMLALFHAGTGLLLHVLAAPMRTNDLVQVAATYTAICPGDILIGDRAFSSYAHLARLFQHGIHAVFRMHQVKIVSFRPHRRHFEGKHRVKGKPSSRWLRRLGPCDQVVEYFKPKAKPAWITADEFARLPNALVVRELRYHTRQHGFRTQMVTLVTTLLDAQRYPASELAELYFTRWQAETNLRHLKQTMGMDILHCKTVAGVIKEFYMFALAYNLVRLVMLEAARRQEVPVERISFVDALRWLCHSPAGADLTALIVNPHRPGRWEPRVIKRRLKEFLLMKKPRAELRKLLLRGELVA
jgi:Transposase DDE domain